MLLLIRAYAIRSNGEINYLPYYQSYPQVFSQEYLSQLQGEILACRYFALNNLNRDFVGTKGFSLVFQKEQLTEVNKSFPYFKPYLEKAIVPQCNAFYLNPLLLVGGSRVDPHIDRSLRSYCENIDPPLCVSVLYVYVSEDLQGGQLTLRSTKRQVGLIEPRANTMVIFQGDLTHSVNPVTSPNSKRLSLVCEQYSLDELQLREIPPFKIESRAIKKERRPKRS